MAGSKQTGLILYESPLSSYVQKVKIALREKGLSFECRVPSDLSTAINVTGELSEASSRKEVPVLIDGDVSIFDSTIIMEYIEEKWPNPALLPTDPVARARARVIEDICDNEYEAINWGLGELKFFKRAEGDLAEEMQGQGRHHTNVIQSWLTDQLGEQSSFFNGETFGWADIAVAPFLNRSVTLGNGPAAGTPLAAWLGRINERQSVIQTFEEYERALPGFQVLAQAIQRGERSRQYRSHRLEWMMKAGGNQIVTDGMEKNTIRFGWPHNK